MLRLESFTVCRSVRRADDGDGVQCAAVLKHVFPAALPDALAAVTVISSWTQDPEDDGQERQAALVVRPPGRAEVWFPLNLPAGDPHFRVVRKLLGIPLPAAGALLFEVVSGGVTLAVHKVTVNRPPARRRGARAPERDEEAEEPGDTTDRPQGE
jgi:hypothetical protein